MKSKQRTSSSSRNDAKSRILQSALELYAKYGFAETRMLDIAKHAKVSHPLMRYYFPSVEALTQAVVNEVLESLKKKTVEYVDRKISPRDRLLDWVSAPFDWGAENSDLVSIWLYLYYQASFIDDIKVQNTEIRQVGRRRIEQILFHGIAMKSFDLSSKSVPDVALKIHTITTGGLVMAFNEKGLSANSVKKICQELCLQTAKA